MKVLTGIDIIEISRIKNSIEELGDSFLNKIYTDIEKEYCEDKKNAKYQHYAARFAAKEAIYKAISEALDNKYEMSWQDVEIVNISTGKPTVNLLKEDLRSKVENIDISISHCKEYATASVVLMLK